MDNKISREKKEAYAYAVALAGYEWSNQNHCFKEISTHRLILPEEEPEVLEEIVQIYRRQNLQAFVDSSSANQEQIGSTQEEEQNGEKDNDLNQMASSLNTRNRQQEETPTVRFNYDNARNVKPTSFFKKHPKLKWVAGAVGALLLTASIGTINLLRNGNSNSNSSNNPITSTQTYDSNAMTSGTLTGDIPQVTTVESGGAEASGGNSTTGETVQAEEGDISWDYSSDTDGESAVIAEEPAGSIDWKEDPITPRTSESTTSTDAGDIEWEAVPTPTVEPSPTVQTQETSSTETVQTQEVSSTETSSQEVKTEENEKPVVVTSTDIKEAGEITYDDTNNNITTTPTPTAEASTLTKTK